MSAALYPIAQGDITESEREAIVCPVNCVMPAGEGVALAVGNRWGAAAHYFWREVRCVLFRPGAIMVVPTYDGKTIYFLATQRHHAEPSDLEWVKLGLQALRVFCERDDVKSIAIPALGCGQGGLDWNDVRPLLEEFASSVIFEVDIYEPHPKAIKRRPAPVERNSEEIAADQERFHRGMLDYIAAGGGTD